MKMGAFCGLGQPFYFRKSLEVAGFDVVFFKAFPDHHSYTRRQFESMVTQASQKGADGLVVTSKDFVKLAEFSSDLPLYRLQMEVTMEPEFDAFVLERVAAVEKKPR
jgi:tetraacyldisaccharide 4'-kinase